MIKYFTRLLIAVLVIAALVPAVFAQSENPLAGTYWQLDSADSSAPVTLGFESEETVAGSGGCNSYSGSYTVEGDSISFNNVVSTLMLCVDTGDQETEFFNALQTATRYELADDQLTLWYADDQQLTFVPDPAGGLVGTQWQLASTADDVPVIADSFLTLEFRADNQVVGAGGCNDFGGSYQIEGEGQIAFTDIISTLMACVNEELNVQEQEYLSALQAATGFTLADDQLTIDYGEGQRLTFVLTKTDVLAATQWQLASFGSADTETSTAPDSLVTIEFVDSSQVSGSGGCNTYSGTYQVNGEMMTFNPLISTRMACTDEAITAQESTFFQALESASRYEVTDEQLLIWYGSDQQYLTFVPLAETA